MTDSIDVRRVREEHRARVQAARPVTRMALVRWTEYRVRLAALKAGAASRPMVVRLRCERSPLRDLAAQRGPEAVPTGEGRRA